MTSILRPVILACLACASLSAADPPYLGMWQEDTHPDDEMHFEPHRATFKNPGEAPAYYVAEYDSKGTIWHRSSVDARKMVVKLTGDHLTIVSGGYGSYHRLAKVPADFEIPAVSVPAKKSVTAERIAALSAEADRRMVDDQAVRTDPARRADMGKVDTDDTAWIKTVIAEAGWPDAGRFGRETASKMFMFVQHSGDMPLMLGVLPCIEKDLQSKAVDPQDFAMLFDRVQMYNGRPQRYGSQIVSDEHGKKVVWLLEDKANVEKIRADIGLFPLAIYLQVASHAMKTTIGFMDSVRVDESVLKKKDGGDASVP